MNLLPITPADYVLDSCGRLVPPAGSVFVDVPRVIPITATQTAAGEGASGSSPFASRVSNQSGTVFYAVGLAGGGTLGFRLRWPSGRALSRGFVSRGNFPLAGAGQQWCFEKPVPWAPGDEVTLEVQGGASGTVNFQFWGFTRWLLALDEAGADGGSCLVGYGYATKATGGAAAALPGGVLEAESSARYSCDPVGQNLAAIEAELGNQCYDGQFCSFSSEAYSLSPQQGAYNQVLQIPFMGVVSLVGLRVRAEFTNLAGEFSDVLYAVRMPDGYQVMGPDLVSSATLAWIPVMPSVTMRGGERLTFDVFHLSASVTIGAAVNVTLEFLCRRRGGSS